MSKHSATPAIEKLKRDRPAPFRRQSGLVSAKISLAVLEKLVRLTPMLGEQLGQVVGIAKDVVCLVEKHHLNQTSNDELVNRMCDTLEIIALAVRDPHIAEAPQLAHDLDRVKVVIEAISNHLHRHYEKHTYERIILTMTNEDTDTNKNFCKQLDQAIQKFNFSSGIQLRLGVQQVQQMLKEGFLDVQSLLLAVAEGQSKYPVTEHSEPCSCSDDSYDDCEDASNNAAPAFFNASTFAEPESYGTKPEPVAQPEKLSEAQAPRIARAVPLQRSPVANHPIVKERGREPARQQRQIHQYHGHASPLRHCSPAPALRCHSPHGQRGCKSPPPPPPAYTASGEPKKIEKTPAAVLTNSGTTSLKTSNSEQTSNANKNSSSTSIESESSESGANTSSNESTLSLASSKISTASSDCEIPITPSDAPAVFPIGHKIKFPQPCIPRYLPSSGPVKVVD